MASAKTGKKRSISLIVSLMLSIGLSIVAMNIFQVLVISNDLKHDSLEDEIADLTRVTDAYVKVIENKIECYNEALDYYTNADIMKSGNLEAIGEWLVEHEWVRDNDFDYIMIAGADGLSYNDIGTRTNIATRDYFQAILNDGKDEYIDNPVISKTTGQSVIHITKALKRNGKTFAMVAGVVNLNKINEEANNIKIGKAGYAWLLASDGMCIAHPDSSLIMQKNFVTDVTEGYEDTRDVAERVASGEAGHQWVKKPTGRELVVYHGFNLTKWGFAISVPETQVFEMVNKVQKHMIIFAAIVIAVLIVIGSILLLRALKPLGVVQKAINGIASGNADLTQRIEIKSNNEIGHVVGGFNKFIEKLQTIIADVKASKEDLGVAGEDMKASTQDTASAITQIIANIESVRRQIVNQSASVEETAGAVNQIASNITSLEHMIGNQAAGVEQASAAVEEMIGNISSVNQSVEKMADSFSDLQQTAQSGFSKQQDVNDRIKQIEEQSAMLQEANLAIAAIAEQTNLLAMNAAIEAAHAGDAGKGFSVVADEIRKLSETSSSQSKTIGDQLNNIKESIGSVVSASQESSSAFEAVSTKIRDTDQLVSHIKSAMEEQNEGSKQISEALHSMNDSSIEVRNASAEMNEGNKAILDEVRRLQEATAMMKGSVDEMSAGATKINETGAALSGISDKVQDAIDKIGNQIDLFKV